MTTTFAGLPIEKHPVQSGDMVRVLNIHKETKIRGRKYYTVLEFFQHDNEVWFSFIETNEIFCAIGIVSIGGISLSGEWLKYETFGKIIEWWSGPSKCFVCGYFCWNVIEVFVDVKTREFTVPIFECNKCGCFTLEAYEHF